MEDHHHNQPYKLRHLRGNKYFDLHHDVDYNKVVPTTHSELFASPPPMIRHLSMIPISSEDPNPVGASQQQQDHVSAGLVWISPFLSLCLLLFFCGGRGAGEQYHRGHQIREQAERIWALQRRKEKRKESSEEERKSQIEENVDTLVVVSKDASTGHCLLARGDSSSESTQHTFPQNSNQSSLESPKTNTMELSIPIQSKPSTDTADTLPISDDDDDEFHETEDDYVCHICLDGFEVGDSVMFRKQGRMIHQHPCDDNKNNSCTHVFHTECLLPWLLEKRENECPSCRALMIPDETDDDDDSESNDVIENESDMETTNPSQALEENTDPNTSPPNDGEDKVHWIVKGRVVVAVSTRHPNRKSLPCRLRDLSPPHRIQKNTFSAEQALSTPIPLRRISQSLDPSIFSKSQKPASFCRRRRNGETYQSRGGFPKFFESLDDGAIVTTTTTTTTSKPILLLSSDSEELRMTETCPRYFRHSDGCRWQQDSDEDDVIVGMLNENDKSVFYETNRSSIFTGSTP